jgi:hypothetical protein
VRSAGYPLLGADPRGALVVRSSPAVASLGDTAVWKISGN